MVPVTDFTGTIEALLSDQPEFGAYDPTRWRAWTYLSGEGKYRELSDAEGEEFRPGPGAAYWLICAREHRISTAPIPGTSTPTDAPFEVTLHPQAWSLVGCPFDFPVSWDSVLIDTTALSALDTVVVGRPIRWTPSGYRNDVSVLEPFQGYWVFNHSANPVTVRIPPREAPEDRSAPSKTAEPPTGDWHVSLSASAGGALDAENRAGVAASASGGLDRNDRAEPPPAPGGSLSLYFVTDGAGATRYSVDVRPPFADSPGWGQVWFFDVAKTFTRETGGDEVRIAFDVSGSLPAAGRMVLVDRALDRRVDLNDGAEYSFYLGTRGSVNIPDQTRFRLLVGDELFVERSIASLLQGPTRTTLRQNYPNPFNPSTIIAYDLAAPGPVSLRVYDVTGALVRVLDERRRPVGRYQVGWDGTNDRGDRISSGVYFYRLTAPGYASTRKMILLK
jgi:hypothetical protein